MRVKFLKRSILNLEDFESDSYDIAFSSHALQYVPDLVSCFEQVNSVLQGDGIFVFSFAHPIYSIIDPKTLKIREPYVRRRVEHVSNWTGKKEAKLIVFKNRFCDIIDALSHAGFRLEKVVEDIDLDDYPTYFKKDKWRWNWGDDYPLDLMRLVPTSIVFKASKLSVS